MRFRFHAPRSLAPTTGVTECPSNLEHTSFGILWDSRRSSFGIFEWRFGKCLQGCSARPASWWSSGIDRSMERPSPRRSLNFSRLVNTGDPIQSTFAGTSRKAAYNVRSIKVDDLFIIVKASLTSHYFTALGSIWRQIRGAGIGSQISPTISNLAVTMVERAWQHSFEALLSQKPLNFVCVRYVDSRFAVFDSACQVRSGRHFFWPEFLWTPSRAGDSMLLGFNVSVSERTVTYQCPNQQIRDIASAVSIRLRLSGLKSRAHLMRKIFISVISNWT